MLKDERFIAVALVVLAAAIGGTVGSGSPNCNECREYLAGVMRRVHILRVLRLEQSVKDSISPSELETINLCKKGCNQSDKELMDSNVIRKKRNVLEDSYQYFYPHYGDKILGLLNYDGYDLQKNEEEGEEEKYVPFLYDESANRFMDSQVFTGFDDPNRNWGQGYNVGKGPILYPEDEDDYARRDQLVEKIVNRFRDVVVEEFRSQLLQVPGYIGYQQNNLILPIVAPKAGDVATSAATGQATAPAPSPAPAPVPVPAPERSQEIAEAPVNDGSEGTSEAVAASSATDEEEVPATVRPEAAAVATAVASPDPVMDQKSAEPIPAPVAESVEEIDNAPASPPPADSAVADAKPSGVEPESTSQDVSDETAEDSEVPDVTTPAPEELPVEKADPLPLPEKSFRNQEAIYPTDCRRSLGLKH